MDYLICAAFGASAAVADVQRPAVGPNPVYIILFCPRRRAQSPARRSGSGASAWQGRGEGLRWPSPDDAPRAHRADAGRRGRPPQSGVPIREWACSSESSIEPPGEFWRSDLRDWCMLRAEIRATDDVILGLKRCWRKTDGGHSARQAGCAAQAQAAATAAGQGATWAQGRQAPATGAHGA